MDRISKAILGPAVAVWLVTTGPAMGATLPREVYARAERFLPWNIGRFVSNNQIATRWSSNDILIYREGNSSAWRFLALDVRKRVAHPAFDHRLMSQALSAALGENVADDRLPIDGAEIDVAGSTLVATVKNVAFACDLVAVRCLRKFRPRALEEAYSADGRWAIFRRGADLWRRDLRTGVETQLTRDGGSGRLYAARPGTDTLVTLAREGRAEPPLGEYSPDGSRFVTQVVDESRVPELPLVQAVPENGQLRPRLWTLHRPLPGDPAPLVSLVVFDLDKGTATPIRHTMTTQLGGPIALQQVSWSADSKRLYILDHQDDYRRLTLLRADVRSGTVIPIITESRETNVLGIGDLRPLVLASGETLWPSERSGWMHLYLYDSRGRLKRQLTSGSWTVREILHVDESRRWLLLAGGGRVAGQDPYYRQIYRLGLDDGVLKAVTEENADHLVRASRRTLLHLQSKPEAGISPDGRFIIDEASGPDRPTRTAVRSLDGRIVRLLGTARVARSLHYHLPEPFSAKAADGVTAIYGTVFLPSDFDWTKRYPVIDLVYPGPQTIQTGKRFLADVTVMPQAQALAELGFLVVAIDGRGTPFRSRAFREESYGKLGTAGFLQDHIAFIRQLAAGRSYVDLDRVAAVGHSGGGFAVMHALCDYPNFFRLGVASSGLHDLRVYSRDWSAKYQGPFSDRDYASQSVYDKLSAMKGKLMLAFGEMDDNVHPANTLRLVDHLIKLNKNFEIIVVPNANHDLDRHPYFVRRMWDFLVRAMLDVNPPPDYQIESPNDGEREPF